MVNEKKETQLVLLLEHWPLLSWDTIDSDCQPLGLKGLAFAFFIERMGESDSGVIMWEGEVID